MFFIFMVILVIAYLNYQSESEERQAKLVRDLLEYQKQEREAEAKKQEVKNE